MTDLDIAKFIHIELGKAIYYDNNYSSQQEVSENEAKHFYTLFKTGEQEYIQDFLMESALILIY